MRNIIILLLIFASLFANATERRTTTSNTSLSDEIWLPTGALVDGDVLIIDHPIYVNGNINYSNINVDIYVNAKVTFGNPSFLKLGSNSKIHFNIKPTVTGDNNDDKLKIGNYSYNESDLENINAGDILSDEGIGLPVELLSFIITTDDFNIILNWSTASESNNDYFLIEKSFDGIKWFILDKINGQGTTNKLSNYIYKDNTKYSENNYYKLTQFDYDGLNEILGIEYIHMKVKFIEGILIPVNDEILSIKYYSYDGREVNSQSKFLIVVVKTNKNVYKKKMWH